MLFPPWPTINNPFPYLIPTYASSFFFPLPMFVYKNKYFTTEIISSKREIILEVIFGKNKKLGWA